MSRMNALIVSLCPATLAVMKRAKQGKTILDAIDTSAAVRVRSSLVLWMRENHAAFAARVSGRVVDWPALAKLFADAGLTDRNGNPPKPEAARKSWQRVRKEVAGKAGGKASTMARLNASDPPAVPSRQPQPKPQPVQPATVKVMAPARGTGVETDLQRVLKEMKKQSGKCRSR